MPEPPPPPTVPTPQQKQQAQALAQSAATQLENGNEEQARAELQRALSLDGGHKLALSLKRQITDDPIAMLGGQSFTYVVRPNDSLSSIAGRFLGDVFMFYALARYNNIAVPRQLATGQSIKIPGKAPPPAVASSPTPTSPSHVPATAPASPPAAAPAPVIPPPPPPPPPPSPGEVTFRAGEAAERAGDLERALREYRKAVQLEHPSAQAKAARVQKALVDRYAMAAHKAFLSQNLQGAIDGWAQVLRVDPANDRAQLELQRCKDLQQKVAELPPAK
jgi:tetratricopeptide (TPR) repeat protein